VTVWEVLLVFAGIPLGVFLLLAAAVYGASSRRGRRYRPGRPFEFTPVWFVAAPERIIGEAPYPEQETAESGTAILPAGSAELAEAGTVRSGSAHGVKGGASGSW
jgi:hypothetical protein